MTCPSCQQALPTASRRCMHCGARIVRLESGVMKTSAVLVASNGSRCVYSSLKEVPEPLRQQVIASTSGRNSGTILIADRRGKEEIEKAARTERRPRIPALAAGPRPVLPPIPRAPQTWPTTWTIALALLIVICGAAAVFFARA